MLRAEAEILRIARSVVPHVRASGHASRETYSCVLIVETDAEKRRINDDAELLEQMREAAAAVGRRPDYLTAESQETVDRRWKGNWNYIWR